MTVLKYWDGATWQTLPGGGTVDVAVGPSTPIRTTETIWVDTDATPVVLRYWNAGAWQDLPAGSVDVAVATAQPTRTTELLWIDPDEPGLQTAPSLVSTLPIGPSDGQECYFQSAAMAVDGIAWHLRYRAGSPSAYKWEYLGGAPMLARIWGEELYANSTYGDLGTLGPDLTTPLAGDYLVAYGARIQLKVAGVVEGWMQLYQAGVATGTSASHVATAQYGAGQPSTEVRANSVPANTLFRGRYATQSSLQFGFSARWLRMTPVRVG